MSLDLGQGARERSEVIREANAEWAGMMKGLDINMDALKGFYRELAMDIKTQKERIGGDWAVAHVLIHREIRDMIRCVVELCLTIVRFLFHFIYFRDILGPELVIINLTMTNEDRNKRLMERHEGNEQIAKIMKVHLFLCFQRKSKIVNTLIFKNQDFKEVLKKGGDKSDMKELEVTADMSREDVLNGILHIIQ